MKRKTRKNPKKNRKGFLLITMGLSLIAAALILVGYNIMENQRAGRKAEKIFQELEKDIQSQEDSEEKPDYLLNPNMEMPNLFEEGYEYIGILEIPALDLQLPVMSEWSYPNLKISPCRYSGSVYQSNMIIAAHNYDRHFGRLKELNIGDEVKFTDVDGNIFYYSVAELEVLQPTDIKEMEDSDWALTLFTCTIGGRTRVTVRCEERN
jgi:sortase A